MRLLLDEMWTPTIALELRKLGFDVIAISEPAHAGRYAGISDDESLHVRKTTAVQAWVHGRAT